MEAYTLRQREGRRQPMRRQMTEELSNKLQAALTALGLDRVVAGVRSLYMEPADDWSNCFLAMSYGEAGELDRLADEILEEDGVSEEDVGFYAAEHSVSHLLGIDVEHVATISRHFDGNPEALRLN